MKELDGNRSQVQPYTRDKLQKQVWGLRCSVPGTKMFCPTKIHNGDTSTYKGHNSSTWHIHVKKETSATQYNIILPSGTGNPARQSTYIRRNKDAAQITNYLLTLTKNMHK